MEKILQYESEEMEKKQEEFAQRLEAKTEEFIQMKDLLAPFTDELGRFWDMSRGMWKKASFDALQKYSHLLDNEEGIRKLADVLGRWTDTETELQEETFQTIVARSRYIPDDNSRTQIDGIENSGDLNRMLPSEAAFLSWEVTEDIFYKKYVEQALTSFKYSGQKKVKGSEALMQRRSQPREQQRGPFVICIDTSASMEGMPEYVAKVLCFAIIRMAAKQKRHCYLISFSVGVQTLDLLQLEHSLDAVADFLSMSFNGGTNINPALVAAITMLQTNEYDKADVLLVSDFIMYDVREDLVDRIRGEQDKGTRFHSLTVSRMPSEQIEELFDNIWVYNPDDKRVIEQVAQDFIDTF